SPGTEPPRERLAAAPGRLRVSALRAAGDLHAAALSDVGGRARRGPLRHPLRRRLLLSLGGAHGPASRPRAILADPALELGAARASLRAAASRRLRRRGRGAGLDRRNLRGHRADPGPGGGGARGPALRGRRPYRDPRGASRAGAPARPARARALRRAPRHLGPLLRPALLPREHLPAGDG